VRTDSALVSIIMPAFNAERYIEESIKSALAQSYPNFELIIINDGSTDRTLEVIERIEDSRIRVIHQPNAGVATARNSGIKKSRGEFIAFLDSDDLWHPLKIQKQVEALTSFPDVGLSYTDTYLFRDKQSNCFYRPYTELNNLSNIYLRLLTHNFIHTLTVMVRANLLYAMDSPEFDPNLFGTEDWDFWIRLVQETKVLHIQEKLAYYRIHSQGISKNFLRHHAEEFKVLEKHIFGGNNLPEHVIKLAYYRWEQEHLKYLIKSGDYTNSLKKLRYLIDKFGFYYTVKKFVFTLALYSKYVILRPFQVNSIVAP
jgi:glycosyltransferase involved in cell wall biosynthesis